MEGYLYIACGEIYIKQAIISAHSLRHVDKNAHVTLITDNYIENAIFDKVITRKMDYSMLDKVRYIYDDSPYERTFYLDSDTYFYSNCRNLFKLLDFFDICLTLAPAENELIIDGKLLMGYMPYNAGLIIYKKNQETQLLFKKWLQIFQEKLEKGYCTKYVSGSEETDQSCLAIALLYSNIKVCNLPNVFNARLPFFINLKGEVKIVHGWEGDYEKVRKLINGTTKQRCWDPVRKKCIYKKNIFIVSKLNIAFKKLLGIFKNKR